MHDETFETLVQTHGPRMLAVARRMVRNDDDARDVVQTAYLSALRSIRQFKRQALLSTWLHRIVVNAALMRLRSQRRRPETAIDDLLPAFDGEGRHVDSFADWAPRADELVEREETRAMVRACIDRLPGSYREILILRDIEELSTGETAELLSISTTAVKVRLHRARQALTTLLRDRSAAL